METPINQEQNSSGQLDSIYELAQSRMQRSPLCNWKKENETSTSDNTKS